MYRYFVAHPGTLTHKEIEDLVRRKIKAVSAAKKFVKDVGGDSYLPLKYVWAGGVSVVRFKNRDNIDNNAWGICRNVAYGYIPKRTPEGDELRRRMDCLPRVSTSEVNELVKCNCGYGSARIHIDAILPRGCKSVPYGFCLDGWLIESGKAEIPNDCIEVTKEEYEKIIPKYKSDVQSRTSEIG